MPEGAAVLDWERGKVIAVVCQALCRWSKFQEKNSLYVRTPASVLWNLISTRCRKKLLRFLKIYTAKDCSSDKESRAA